MVRDLARSLQRTLTHLKPPPTKGGKFSMPIPSHFRPAPGFVQVKDRIPFWHVAPGDRVKVVKGSSEVKNRIGTVERVDRENNLVFLNEPSFSVKKRQFNEYPGQSLEPNFSGRDAQSTYSVPKPIHLSNLRLQIRDGAEEYTATRVRKGPVSWDRRLRRFSWKRYALVPQLGGIEGDADKGWRELPWPKENVPTSEPGALDNTATTALRTSFVPTVSSLSLAPRPKTLPQSPLKPISLRAGAPPEIRVGQLDLGGNYYSRANKTERFNQRKAEDKQYGKLVMKDKGKKGAFASQVLV
ncbi:KOW motif domain-containing protein [Sporobolomyces koalae]|uniref:KOW motif domain-containing protein n=1 Tax=Sporobolomyces koalae TaxID=500713 RepID=UPI00317E7665